MPSQIASSFIRTFEVHPLKCSFDLIEVSIMHFELRLKVLLYLKVNTLGDLITPIHSFIVLVVSEIGNHDVFFLIFGTDC